jgi:hypothetical protein
MTHLIYLLLSPLIYQERQIIDKKKIMYVRMTAPFMVLETKLKIGTHL